MNIGQSLPEFSLPIDGGQTLNSADLIGKWAVIYFYPKDLTPGCTTEAINFSDMESEFASRNATILGISKDPVKQHDKFVEKHNLKIRLGSDQAQICEAFGVWVEKSMYGKNYIGIERSTFLFDPEGKLCEVWHKVKVKDHATKVLEALDTQINRRERGA